MSRFSYGDRRSQSAGGSRGMRAARANAIDSLQIDIDDGSDVDSMRHHRRPQQQQQQQQARPYRRAANQQRMHDTDSGDASDDDRQSSSPSPQRRSAAPGSSGPAGAAGATIVRFEAAMSDTDHYVATTAPGASCSTSQQAQQRSARSVAVTSVEQTHTSTVRRTSAAVASNASSSVHTHTCMRVADSGGPPEVGH